MLNEQSALNSCPQPCCGSCDKQELPIELSQLLIFQNLKSESLAILSEFYSTLSCKQGQVLFVQDYNADFIYIIRSGWVKLTRETIDGQEAIIDVLTRGHIFGDSAFFNNNIYQYTSEIIENSNLIRIPLAVIDTIIKSDQQFAINLMNMMAKYRYLQDIEIEHRSLQNAPQRIGCFLLRLLPPHRHSGSQTIQIPFDKLLLAGRLGMKPETLSRGLARMKDDLGIAVKGGTIHVPSIEKMVEYTCSACTHSFPCDDLR